MTQIIRLNREVSQTETCEPIADTESGEVILFPGVRYERWSEREQATEETSAAGAARVQADTTRDWLEV